MVVVLGEVLLAGQAVVVVAVVEILWGVAVAVVDARLGVMYVGFPICPVIPRWDDSGCKHIRYGRMQQSADGRRRCSVHSILFYSIFDAAAFHTIDPATGNECTATTNNEKRSEQHTLYIQPKMQSRVLWYWTR